MYIETKSNESSPPYLHEMNTVCIMEHQSACPTKRNMYMYYFELVSAIYMISCNFEIVLPVPNMDTDNQIIMDQNLPSTKLVLPISNFLSVINSCVYFKTARLGPKSLIFLLFNFNLLNPIFIFFSFLKFSSW